jgi:lipopolysaccharide biosynthesis glycosyltransferase
MHDDPVHIALPSDQNYFCGLQATAASLACYARPDAELVFHVLDGGIRDEMFASLEELIRRLHPRSHVRRHAIDEDAFRNFPVWSGSRMTYARLLLPRLLPEARHVIYSDVDMLWLADVAELWQHRDDDVVLQSTRDGCRSTLEREGRWHARHGYPLAPDAYFCAGLTMYNLERFRAERLMEASFDFLDRHRDVPFSDQTALNVLLAGRVRLLPQRWQRLTRDVTAAELREPIVLHYAGELPWRRPGWWDMLTDTVMLWHRFNDRLVGVRGGSLAQHFTPWQVFYKRSLAVALYRKPLRALFYQLCRATGRGAYCQEFDVWIRDLKLGAGGIDTQRWPSPLRG